MRIGILGAGQLGRMLTLDGMRLGHEFSLYDPAGKASAGVGTIYNDPDGQHLGTFLNETDVVTYEFEHLPLELVNRIATEKPVHPVPRALQCCQNRTLEKALFRDLGISTAPFEVVASAEELQAATQRLGGRVVAKSATEGYDGKGQAVLDSPEQAPQAWPRIGCDTAIAESFVAFRRELSIVAARGQDGEMAFYPLAENIHHQGILRFSIAPAPHVTPDLEDQAQRMIRTLMNELGYVGVLALEMFETEEGLVANEMAPRVHNSGHWSQNGAVTSQFENHIRAVSGLPLGETAALQPTCMINLIGEKGPVAEILRLPYTHLHLYGKAGRSGRKVGHINILADSLEELRWRAMNTASLLPECPEFDWRP
ncbi:MULTISPECIES: 5-(carboxyamino)imidazole ribonucleotide synthase [Halomonadaceae]|uniref:N5-carboxyaminoimidazole ribonucleotide synthase n=1 Tax=Vreelandella halophila TaxID=86177 RepID=A0A9X4Y9B3_9GAMM|nr:MULTISPECIES: 5-(carboxyamino)imidazole ribonucleotide synthase [Halomonas]MYL25599.1 5-(carboxyamino)imidazole ribonucleotide synthase [Halomonas utahensis]MYL74835.1 5-(carboxyamino)imidazole ribonucleotide synthase [Halomonas sp. 22501_18_FS]